MLMKENKEYVRKMLKKHKYDDASLTGWGRLDDLIAVMRAFNVFKIFDDIKVDIKEECAIPRWFINNILALKLIIGDRGINSLQNGMFKDVGVLKMVGCTAREVREGFDSERNKASNKPCNVDSLRYSVNNTNPAEFAKSFRKHRRELWKHKKLRSYTYIMDATKLIVHGDYEGAGQIIRSEKVLQKNGTVKVNKIIEKGYKLVTLNRLLKGEVIVEAARLIPINEHEITAIENNSDIAKIYQNFFPKDEMIIDDAHNFLLKNFQLYDFIWSSPPCPTHSVCNHFLKGQGIYRFPDMKLYEEIIFLKHFFKGKWVVENVKSYYKPLIEPQYAGRHAFWTNFYILPIKVDYDIGTMNRKASKEKQRKAIIREAQIPEFLKLHDLKNFKLKNKRQVLRNCVLPKLGKHILDCALKLNKQKPLF